MLLVEDVNHGQVASGDPSILPSTVVDHDVDSDVDAEEAHLRYFLPQGLGRLVVSFLGSDWTPNSMDFDRFDTSLERHLEVCSWFALRGFEFSTKKTPYFQPYTHWFIHDNGFGPFP